MPAEPSPLRADDVPIRVEPSGAVHARGGVVRLAGIEEPALVREDAAPNADGPVHTHAAPAAAAAPRGRRATRAAPPAASSSFATRRRPRRHPRRHPVVVRRTRTLAPVARAPVVAVFVAAVVALARSDRRGRRPRAEVVPGQQRGFHAGCVVAELVVVVEIVVLG